MMELTEDLMKFMQIGLTVLGVLTIFLLFINYNVKIIHNDARREAYYFGDYLLGSKCLALTDNDNVLKSFFSESKLDAVAANPSCIKYTNGMVEIKLLDGTKNWTFEMIVGGTYKLESANFTIAVEMNDGSIKPAKMGVTV